METLPRLHEDERIQRDVDAFLVVLRQQQSSLLEGARQAASALHGTPGHLASLAARHLRLTQLFLDAQRALLLRAAEVEQHIAGIGGANGGPVDGRDLALVRADERERQLADLLDRWWSAEVADGRTVMAVAETRVGETHEVLSPVLAALDAADPEDLDPLLAALVACFEPVVEPVAVGTPALVAGADDERDEAFERFWSSSWLGTSVARIQRSAVAHTPTTTNRATDRPREGSLNMRSGSWRG